MLVASAIAAPTGPYEGVGAIYKGPDSETIIKGPDGSRITSHAEGAALATKEEELKPIVGPAPVPHKVEKPKTEIKGASEKSAKASGGKAADEAAEEVVGIAEEVVAKRPKADAVIFALQEPEGYVFPKGEVEFEAESAKGGYWGEGEEEDGGEEEEEEEGDDEKEDYEPFVIKAY